MKDKLLRAQLEKSKLLVLLCKFIQGVDALLPTVEMSETPNIKPEEVVQVGQSLKR